ncbi:hypothetical protein NDU88_006640 [Pleurodeles waltl]|uniref:Uncharacterized protein n=1 Tax=Pleurodeles waltl TaxID=8319 RepID=A0AAV7NTW1_PLEWA|nr:hypothetical protein NDU88_006640 [Pleurodeles waltl]
MPRIVPPAQGKHDESNAEERGPSLPQKIDASAMDKCTVVHEVPCSNRFSLLEILDPAPGTSNVDANLETSSHRVTDYNFQEEVVNLIIGLKKEVNKLQLMLTEALTLLRSTAKEGDAKSSPEKTPTPAMPSSIKPSVSPFKEADRTRVPFKEVKRAQGKLGTVAPPPKPTFVWK